MSPHSIPPLTKAEAAVLSLLDAGLSTSEVARELSISVGTVKCHLHHAFAKLDARNRLEAIIIARRTHALPTTCATARNSS
jgi:two-component system, NarL family, nitrate/nitrite response regulator NarL